MIHECFVLEEVKNWTSTEQRIFWFFENTEGLTRVYRAYLQDKKPTRRYISSEWPVVKNLVLESVKRTEKSETESKTIIRFLKDSDELVKVANKTLQTVKDKYFYRRCKKKIRGKVLRNHGISWVRVLDGVFTHVVDNEFYEVDKITGLLFEHQHPHPFSQR